MSAKRDRPTERRPSWNAEALESGMKVVTKMWQVDRVSQSHARPAGVDMMEVMTSRRWRSARRAAFSASRTDLRSAAFRDINGPYRWDIRPWTWR